MGSFISLAEDSHDDKENNLIDVGEMDVKLSK